MPKDLSPKKRGKTSTPILFGRADRQRLLVDCYLNGSARLPAHYSRNALILKSGFVYQLVVNGILGALDQRHPGYQYLLETLKQLTGKPPGRQPKMPTDLPPHSIWPNYPLMHYGKTINFRMIFYTILAGKNGISRIELHSKMHDQWMCSIDDTIQRHVNDGILEVGEGTGPAVRLRLHSRVPAAFKDLVLAIADHLAVADPRFARNPIPPPRRIAAFNADPDSLPRLFGTTIRLNTLMALAKYGPLNYADLRRVLGGDAIRLDDPDNAPFGRSGVVRIFDTPEGAAAMLDRNMPVYRPLRRLLLKLESVNPLPPLIRQCSVPKPPPKRPWAGDPQNFFGSPMPTGILMSIGAQGWSFEKLCTEVCIGRYRENVKTVLHRLEDEGVLSSDRKRGPGFGPRVVRISMGFPAHKELTDLLKACVKAWPQFASLTETAMAHLGSKTKQYFRNRGMEI